MISAAPPARATLPRTPASRAVAACLALVILAVFAWRMVVSVPGNSVTYDESVHVTRGFAALKYHDLRLNIEHPVLGDALAALPLLADSSIRFPLDSAAWRNAEHWVVADDFLWHLNRRPQAMVDTARYSVVLMSILLALVVAAWATDLYGWAGALLALLLYTLSPTVIANSILATNDLSLALFSTLYAWLLWRFTRRPCLARGILCALALAAAATCKYSGLVLVVDTVLLLPIAGWLGRKDAPDTSAYQASSRWLWNAALRTGAILLGAALVVWIMYGGHLQPLDTPTVMRQEVGESFAEFIQRRARRPDDGLIASPGSAVEAPPPLPHNRRWQLLTGIPLPAPQYLRGLADNMMQARGGHRAYLNGRVSRYGWWYYFPEAFLLKTPIPLLLIMALAAGALYLFRDPAELFLAVPVAVLLFVAMRAHIDIGIRHLLPVYPLLAIFCGRLLQPQALLRAHALQTQGPWRQPVGRALVYGMAAVPILLCAWFALESASIHPLYLTYFNQLAGGPDKGWRYLADSNLDWGQDLIRLSCELNRRGIKGGIGLAYFGTAEPAAYGITYQPLDPTTARGAGVGSLGLYGWIALSVSEAAYFGERHEGLAWLSVRRPAFVVGHTIRVYHIPLPSVKPGVPKPGAHLEQVRKLHSDQLLE